MMIRKKIWITLVLLLLSIGICSGSEEVIYKITVLGNVKVEEGVVRAAVKSREGGPFSAEQVREDLRSVFGLGYFSDVQIDIKTTPKGREIIFVVMEKPSIKEILITGNQKVKLDDIREKVTLTSRSILNLEKVKENAEQIRRLYFSKGYYGVNVGHKVDYLETNEAIITFQITEGLKGHIRKIVFKGNKKIKPSELKKIMLTKQRNILSIITKTGILDEDILKNDIQLLTAYYIDHGYLDVNISEPRIDLHDPKRIQIEIEIAEGPQYRFGEIDFTGDILTSKEDLFRSIKIKRNNVYSTSAIRRDINGLTEKFANQGYANVEVTPATTTDPTNLFVHVTFEIEKKKQVSFEKIQIVGNTKTRDKVIRRELQIAEGELYSATGISKSRDRLKRTGFFKEVNFTTSRGSTEEKTNLEVKVEEAPTGALSFGIGYSSIENVVGSASISDRNLFGLGYHGVLNFRLGSETRDLKFSFTDPYFLGSTYSAGIDLYNENREFDTYSSKIFGGTIRSGKELTETIRADATYKLEKIKIHDVSIDASRFIKEQEGNKLTSAISFSLSMDTRNDYYNPTRGARHGLSLQNAGGILGGDNYFVKVVADTSWYFPLPLHVVLNLRGKVGFIEPYSGREAPIYEKFFVGGLHTVRGFEYGMAGPFDVNKESLGAKKMVAFNSELIFPLSREIGLRGALFWDVGKGFDRFSDLTPLKMGVGVGIRWFSPFGPIHIDLGFNPNPKPGEKRKVFDFTAGTVY
ncbi:MAG: outer membrane protein assembly factor BamA [Thermodesulfobacteriota bacterium]|nr:outer membrane protein assembly factor BamA [Thermodesulfobacteriota bacterium]